MLNTRMSAFSARNRARHDGDIKTWGDGEKGEMRMLLTFVDEQYRRAPVEQEGRGECRVTSRSAESVKTENFLTRQCGRTSNTSWGRADHLWRPARSDRRSLARASSRADGKQQVLPEAARHAFLLRAPTEVFLPPRSTTRRLLPVYEASSCSHSVSD